MLISGGVPCVNPVTGMAPSGKVVGSHGNTHAGIMQGVAGVALTSVVEVGAVVPLVPWGHDDLAPPALLAHVEPLLAAVRRLAQQAQLLHERWDIDKGVVVCFQNEPA